VRRSCIETGCFAPALALLSLTVAGLIGETPTADAAPGDAPAAAAAQVAQNPNRPVDGCTKGSEDQNFFSRLKDSYHSHLAWNGGDPSALPSRVVGGAEMPESSPPWPYSTWNIGGTQNIGVENMASSALMDALYCGEYGQKLKDSRFTIYGWIEPGGNLSTSHTHFNYATGTGGNFPSGYAFEPNTVQLDQAALYLERTPDEIQLDHVDWGFRVAGLYGTDYKYTFSNGVLSNQYLDNARQYGFDPMMYYLDFWFPKIGMGTNVRVGRYTSIPDIESQPAPNNLTYSHSLLDIYDPFTQTGILATTKLRKNWQIQLGITDGNDVAPWVKSERHPTAQACVFWTSDSGDDGLYPCINALNGGSWGWDNVQHTVVSWYHKFSSQWHTDTEAWYMWQSHTPNVDNPDGLALIGARYPQTFGAPSGAHCNPALITCYSYEWAIVNYINYQLGPRDTATWRTGYMDDATGQRTGFRTRYMEYDLSYTHWVGDVIELRPELRFEHARNAEAYDNPTDTPEGGRHSQAMVALDAILHF